MNEVAVKIDGYERVDDQFVIGMDALVVYHTVNIILGALCTVIAGANLFIFLSTVKFRIMYKVCSQLLLLLFEHSWKPLFQILAALAVADFINTISKMMMGINRRDLYSNVLESHLIPIRTSWDCAIEPWLWMQGIGKNNKFINKNTCSNQKIAEIKHRHLTKLASSSGRPSFLEGSTSNF